MLPLPTAEALVCFSISKLRRCLGHSSPTSSSTLMPTFIWLLHNLIKYSHLRPARVRLALSFFHRSIYCPQRMGNRPTHTYCPSRISSLMHPHRWHHCLVGCYVSLSNCGHLRPRHPPSLFRFKWPNPPKWASQQQRAQSRQLTATLWLWGVGAPWFDGAAALPAER